MDNDKIGALNLRLIEDYLYDDGHHSYVYERDNTCIIVDDNLCKQIGDHIFDYSKYCEMQNKYVNRYDLLYRFNMIDNSIYSQVEEWLNKKVDDIQLEDKGNAFSKGHVDNTPLEKKFEDVFTDIYGNDALAYLNKEVPVSLNNGHTCSIDYVLERDNGNIAIEENGVTYHHPVIIGNDRYAQQLEKQNTLALYNYKVYRFSAENLMFKNSVIERIKHYFGTSSHFKPSTFIKEKRKVHLYEHQETILEDLKKHRANGETTALVVLPTGTGKSQIVLEDLNNLAREGKIHRVLIMVPSHKVKEDWENRVQDLRHHLNITIEFYNLSFISRNRLPSDYYDYICFDEAHHAQAVNCHKTLTYFNPKYLVGLTATDERLDMKKLQDIFGEYDKHMSLEEAVEKNIITNIRCFRVESNIDLSEVRYNGKDYNYADLERTLVIDSRNELITSTIKKYFMPRNNFYKQGIVFCVNIQHAKKIAEMFNEAGLTARAVYGGNKENDQIFKDYRNKKIQFLTSCQQISEGWDSPQTEIVVMARPTLSKVLYLQQLGRGVRHYPGKECLYVIDVVDNYDGKLTPWNFNSLFHLSTYSPFMGLKKTNNEYLKILGLSEHEITMKEVDILTFEEKYNGYLSLEQAARELYIGTQTLRTWVRSHKDYSSLSLPIGNRIMPYFSSSDIEHIRKDKHLKIHNDETLLQDFEDFIDENTLTFSFKLVFILSMFKLADKEGEVRLDALVEEYRQFYLNRIARKLPVDKANCAYTADYLNNDTKIKKSLLDNPFEKFERKRFVMYSKDLNIVEFNPTLWSQMNQDYKNRIILKEQHFLEEYYQDKGGL